MKLLADALKPGDTIGLVSPSNTIDDDDDYQAIEQSMKWAESQGLNVVKGKYFGINKTGYGLTGKQKAEELNEMFANKDVKAIFAIRGGENSNAAFDYLDWETIKNNPKIIMGFSDTTSLLNEINYQTGLVTFSGPTFKRLYESEYSKKSVVDRLINKDLKLATEEDYSECEVIREGKAEGELVGSNLTLTSDLIFGKYKIDFKDKILVMEDLGWESIPGIVSHNLYKMRAEGIFDEIAGIWIGNYESDSGITLEQILMDTLADIEFNKPIIKTNNFGHSDKNQVVPIGVKAVIDTTAEKPYIFLQENCLN
jgi:muramoyltetrapeptide carboxypeptidase